MKGTCVNCCSSRSWGKNSTSLAAREPNRSSAICLRTVRFRDNSNKKRIVWQLTGR